MFLESADLKELGLTGDPVSSPNLSASPVGPPRSLSRYIPSMPVPSPQPILHAAVRGGKEVSGAVAGSVSGVVG